MANGGCQNLDKRKVIYYSDELKDEFSLTQITPRVIDESYTYIHKSFFKHFTHFFWYRVVFTPIAFFYTKIKFRHKVIGKEKFKSFKKSGYFIYGNHTQDLGDAFMPNMMNFPKHNYMIVHPNNVSMPFLGRITPSLGALPLPGCVKAYRNFASAVHTHIESGHAVVIYPEAHIWPFYTKIRPFSDESFVYPIKENVPSFCFTNTYQKRKHSKKGKVVTYIDGPFYPNATLSARERRLALRNEIFNTMTERAKLSDHIQIQYIKKEGLDG